MITIIDLHKLKSTFHRALEAIILLMPLCVQYTPAFSQCATAYLWSTGENTKCINMQFAGTVRLWVTYDNGSTVISDYPNVAAGTNLCSSAPSCCNFGGNITTDNGQSCVNLTGSPMHMSFISYLWCTGETTRCVTGGSGPVLISDLNECRICVGGNCDDCGTYRTWYRDADGDGFGDPNNYIQIVTPPSGFVLNNNDCNDNPENGGVGIYPGATGSPVAIVVDVTDCSDSISLGAYNPDCNSVFLDHTFVAKRTDGLTLSPIQNLSENKNIFIGTYKNVPPGAYTFQGCNNAGKCFSINAMVTCTWYRDLDKDGFGDEKDPGIVTNSPPQGYVKNNSDCDDTNETINPDKIWYLDYDGDHRYGGITRQQCLKPTGNGWTDRNGLFNVVQIDYCDDDSTRYPGKRDDPGDGFDANCDGLDGEGKIWYHDQDRDDFFALDTIFSVEAPGPEFNWVTIDNWNLTLKKRGDCNDNDSTIHPEKFETPNDGIDQNCDGKDEIVENCDKGKLTVSIIPVPNIGPGCPNGARFEAVYEWDSDDYEFWELNSADIQMFGTNDIERCNCTVRKGEKISGIMRQYTGTDRQITFEAYPYNKETGSPWPNFCGGAVDREPEIIGVSTCDGTLSILDSLPSTGLSNGSATFQVRTSPQLRPCRDFDFPPKIFLQNIVNGQIYPSIPSGGSLESPITVYDLPAGEYNVSYNYAYFCRYYDVRKVTIIGGNIFTQPLAKTTFATGSTLSVPFNSSITQFNADNIFTAQLSDETGSFLSPTNLTGSLPSTNTSGIFEVQLPADIEPGSDYRIRVLSSSPRCNGDDNGSDLNIIKGQIITGDVTGSPFCPKRLIVGQPSFQVRFTSDVTFQNGNQFQLQLSNGDGSFFNSTLIGTLDEYTTPATIDGYLTKGSMPPGNNYRVRVVSTDPEIIGSTNETNIIILNGLDTDNDGYTLCTDDPVNRPPDCDDTDTARHPGNEENCSDNIDNDCDLFVDNEPCQAPKISAVNQSSTGFTVVWAAADCVDGYRLILSKIIRSGNGNNIPTRPTNPNSGNSCVNPSANLRVSLPASSTRYSTALCPGDYRGELSSYCGGTSSATDSFTFSICRGGVPCSQPVLRTAVQDEELVLLRNAEDLQLNAYPNPFKDRINIEFVSSTDTYAKLEVFDLTGNRLAILFEGKASASEINRFEYISSGQSIVLYRLQTENSVIYGRAVAFGK